MLNERTRMPASRETTSNSESSPKTWRRRGLLAAAATAVAAAVAKLTEQPTLAGTDGDVVLGAANSTSGVTAITCQTAGGFALDGRCDFGTGIRGAGELGVVGLSNGIGSNNAGVYGLNTSSSGWAIYGTNGNGVAVRGDGVISHGVVGISSIGVGVYGQINSSSNGNTTAVYGLNYSTYTGLGPGAGSFGVYGLSANGHGLVGATAAAGAAAVVGATNGVAGAYAASFFGHVVVDGDFTVVGGGKSAAVQHPDGTHRRLYCVESPESWFEDFGESELACGQADVVIDRDFAAVTDLSAYHVFLTAYGDFDLHVSERGSESFRVQAKDSSASGRFSWRVVAKRKDINAPRFETVTTPTEPMLPNIPQPPAAPEPTRPRGVHPRG
jgi:hypothetical protein